MRTPILTYHAVSASEAYPNDIYELPFDGFKMQMEHIYTNGYKVVSLKNIIDNQNTYKGIEDRSIALTFDDGYISDFTLVYPLLKSHGFSAVFFVIVNYIDKPGFMSWKQLRELESNGMTIGSHTMNHLILTKMKDSDIEFELKESKRILEEKLLFPIDFLSIPRGFWNNRITDIARRAGYKGVFTSDEGCNDLNKNLYIFKRIVIRRDYSINGFKNILSNNKFFRFIKKIEKFTKMGLKQLLSLKVYEKIKRKWLDYKESHKKC